MKSGSISLGMVQEIWPDGFGCAIDFHAGLTFIALAGGIGYNAYFFRRGNHLAIHFSAMSEMGLAVGIGGGLSINKRGKKRGIGAEAGIDAEVMGNNMGLIEYEIPLQAGVLANFLWNQAKGLFQSDEDKTKAANEFVETFDDDPAIFVTKAVVQMGTRAQVTGGAGVTVMNTGDNTRRTDVGGGKEMASYTSNTTDRKSTDEKLTPYRQSDLDKVRGILGGGKKGIQDAGMSQLGQLLQALTGVSAGAGTGYKMGIEYGKTANGEDKVSLFLEGSAWASLGLPVLPALAVEAGIGGRMVYVKSKRWGVWQPGPPELYLFGGDLDNYTGNAYELNIQGTKEPSSGDAVDQIIEHLRRMKFTKRFMVTLGSAKLMRYKTRLHKFKSLLGSDAQAKGVELKAAVTVEVDLGRLSDQSFNSFENQIKESGTDLKSNPLIVAKNAVSSILNEGGNREYISLFKNLITSDSVTKCTVHVEAGYGGAIGGKVGGGAKLQVDLGGSVGLVYEATFSGAKVFGFIEDELIRKASTDSSANINRSSMPLLAEAINSSQAAMDEFTTLVLGKAR